MSKFDDMKISNIDELFLKTKTVAESLNKKGSQALELSRKRIEYLDTKAKISKLYEKFGKLQFDAMTGNEIDDDELDMLNSQIIAYREKMVALKAELDEASDTTDLKRDAEALKNEVIIASQEAKGVIMDMYQNAKNAFAKAGQQSSSADAFEDELEVIEVEPQSVESDDVNTEE